MSCSSHGKNSGECVCDVVRKIVKAQDEVAAAQEDCCTTGCEQSIDQLLSPTTGNANGPTTIPFLLYCKGDCDVFFARGIRKDNSHFECVETPIFKAKRFKKDCCVELELLRFQTQGATPNPSSFKCGIIPPNATGKLIETGICITVDLHCFCAIQCLDATTPLSEPA